MGGNVLASMMRDEGFWRAIADCDRAAKKEAVPFDDAIVRSVRAELRTSGYFRRPNTFGRDDLAPVVDAIERLARTGLPAIFVFAYEAPWRLFQRLERLLDGVLDEGYEGVAAFWAWRIAPLESGWGRHRDRNGISTLDADGTPRIVTLWIALTDATTENGCIRVVPRSDDPGYATATGANARASVPLPIAAGGLLGWTHHLLHWGGTAASSTAPRVSLSAEFQRAGEAFDDVVESIPPLDERLALIGAQILRYRHMTSPSTQLVELAEHLSVR